MLINIPASLDTVLEENGVHLKDITGPLQFASRAKCIMRMYFKLQHVQPLLSCRLSALVWFPPPSSLISSTINLTRFTVSTYQLITSFMKARKRQVKLEKITYSICTLCTGASNRCMFSPLLFHFL